MPTAGYSIEHQQVYLHKALAKTDVCPMFPASNIALGLVIIFVPLRCSLVSIRNANAHISFSGLLNVELSYPSDLDEVQRYCSYFAQIVAVNELN